MERRQRVSTATSVFPQLRTSRQKDWTKSPSILLAFHGLDGSDLGMENQCKPAKRMAERFVATSETTSCASLR
jgi:hypothetical protein